MTAPINPMNYSRAPSGIVGTKVPNKTSPMSGLTAKKLIKKQVAIIDIRKAKKNYRCEMLFNIPQAF